MRREYEARIHDFSHQLIKKLCCSNDQPWLLLGKTGSVQASKTPYLINRQPEQFQLELG